MTDVVRPTLGSYMSIECFRFLRFGAEDTAGRALIVASGKQRGHSLSDVLKGVSADDVAQITATLAKILGVDGTRLCVLQDIAKTEHGYTVRVTESACSTGVTADEPNCAYGLGVFIGAFETIIGKRMFGNESACVAIGNDTCVYNLEVIG